MNPVHQQNGLNISKANISFESPAPVIEQKGPELRRFPQTDKSFGFMVSAFDFSSPKLRRM